MYVMIFKAFTCKQHFDVVADQRFCEILMGKVIRNNVRHVVE